MAAFAFVQIRFFGSAFLLNYILLGLLLIGSLDPTRFSPAHGTDLLRFFAQVFRLVLIGWLRE